MADSVQPHRRQPTRLPRPGILQARVLGIKKTGTEMKNTLNELMNSLLIINAVERIYDLEDISVELSKIE